MQNGIVQRASGFVQESGKVGFPASAFTMGLTKETKSVMPSAMRNTPERRISRKHFIKLSGVIVLGVAACGIPEGMADPNFPEGYGSSEDEASAFRVDAAFGSDPVSVVTLSGQGRPEENSLVNSIFGNDPNSMAKEVAAVAGIVVMSRQMADQLSISALTEHLAKRRDEEVTCFNEGRLPTVGHREVLTWLILASASGALAAGEAGIPGVRLGF